MVAIVQQHLQSLTESYMWIIDPFVANNENNKLNMSKKASSIYHPTPCSKLNSWNYKNVVFDCLLKMNTNC